jgi:hypothetical protein
MLLADLDRYYTPDRVARSLIERCPVGPARTCFDSSCGDGSLLTAAQAVIPRVKCLGLDVDGVAIRRLRRENPHWMLAQADALASSSWSQIPTARKSVGCDLVVLNPPFSMVSKKGTLVDVPGFQGRCSVAMAHLLTVLVRSRPRCCAAVVPESLLFSELDAKARECIARLYTLEEGPGLRNSTFGGTRANAVLVTLETRESNGCVEQAARQLAVVQSINLVRGGLPVFESMTKRGGIPYVHSTDLARLAGGLPAENLRKVKPIARGVVNGHVLLLPRVGVPLPSQTRSLFFRAPVQLSDCVVALKLESRTAALAWEEAIHDRWNKLIGLYHGTGARYTTVTRLATWVMRIESEMSRQSVATSRPPKSI